MVFAMQNLKDSPTRVANLLKGVMRHPASTLSRMVGWIVEDVFDEMV